jgi:hypothetical protein
MPSSLVRVYKLLEGRLRGWSGFQVCWQLEDALGLKSETLISGSADSLDCKLGDIWASMMVALRISSTFPRAYSL